MIEILGKRFSLAQAKTLRDELSEEIFEAEGGDPDASWSPVVYEKTVNGRTARVVRQSGRWQVTVRTDCGSIFDAYRNSVHEAFESADKVL